MAPTSSTSTWAVRRRRCAMPRRAPRFCPTRRSSRRILERVVAAVDVPVTLKIRTGPDPGRRNAVRIARIAEAAGIAAIAVHGRTRRCAFKGAAEYDSIREVKRAVSIPGHRQRRHHEPGAGSTRARLHRRRRGDDRTRRSGQPLAARRDRGLSSNRSEGRAAERTGAGRRAAWTPARTACVLRRDHRGSGRAQASVVVLQGIPARGTRSGAASTASSARSDSSP